MRQSLRGHARSDSLPQSIERTIGLKLRFVGACTGIPERKFFLNLAGTAPVTDLRHTLAQFGCGLRYRQNISAVHHRLTRHHSIDPKPLHIQANRRHFLAHFGHLNGTHARLEPQGFILQSQTGGTRQCELPRVGMRRSVRHLRQVFLFPEQQVQMASRELPDSTVGVLPSGTGLAWLGR